MSLAWVALSSVSGLGPATFNKLIEHFGSPEAVFDQSAQHLRQAGLASELIQKITAPETLVFAEKQLKMVSAVDGVVLTRIDKAYPACLREIFAAPPVLYVRGDVEILQKHAVAIVGARSPTVYGKQAAKKIAGELAEQHLVVVSGLARGIDAVAHEATIDAGGKTIAVLGSGIDGIYPVSNRELGERIIKNGCLLSEFSLGVPPEAFNFPRRNRIISGCSAAVVVVEAGEKSGSLITARYALQQGREVCAVPGPINSAMSRGTFNLIRDGAQPVRSGKELAESLTVLSLPRVSFPETESGSTSEIPETIFTQSERNVYDVLTTEPQRIDAIAELNGMDVAELFVVLLNLELKGVVQQCSGQRFVKTGN